MTSSVVNGFTAGLASAATLFVLSTLMQSVKAKARKEGELSVVEYGRAMKLLVIVFWLVIAAGGGMALFASKEDRPVAACAIGGFFVLVLILHLETFRVRIVYDLAGIRTRSPWRPGRSIPWEEVTGVEFSKAAQWYLIKTGSHGAIRLHLYLSGVGSFLDELAGRGFEVPPSPLYNKL